MTWRETTVLEERAKFIQEALDVHTKLTFEQLCEKFNISRKTGYKWFHRFLENGQEGLKDKSKTRLTYPDKIEGDIERAIIEIRKEYPMWGPKKIHALMVYRGIQAPSKSSIGNILKKHDLSKKRHYRRHVAQTAPLSDCLLPNDVWMYDFKGYFRTGDGKICEPLTITDGFSRYLIKCNHMPRKRTEDVWEVLKEAFLEYGKPLRIRSDNGPPFATIGIGRLSPLSIKIIKAGVTPEWIEPGEPQQNGRHERFHLTLKNETASPPASKLQLQILKMEKFKDYYNNERPHEALGQVPPNWVYMPSERKWDGRLREIEYDENQFEIRKVGKSGSITWKGEAYFLSESLYGEYTGIKEIERNIMGVFYGPILLGKIDLDKGFKKM